MDMIERVARALCSDFGDDPDSLAKDWRGAVQDFPAWQRWTGAARVAIDAMREPTGEMLTAMRVNLGGTDELHIDEAEEAWKNAIDAALLQHKPKADIAEGISKVDDTH